jgi:hypothetical protein
VGSDPSNSRLPPGKICGYWGYFISFAKLVAELYASLADHSETKVIRKYWSYDCLVIDEVGYVEVEPAVVLYADAKAAQDHPDYLESGF